VEAKSKDTKGGGKSYGRKKELEWKRQRKPVGDLSCVCVCVCVCVLCVCVCVSMFVCVMRTTQCGDLLFFTHTHTHTHTQHTHTHRYTDVHTYTKPR
jgi:hypothetical protein